MKEMQLFFQTKNTVQGNKKYWHETPNVTERILFAADFLPIKESQ